MNANILKAIAVVAELTGTELSKDALRMMVDDLSNYSEAAVLKALHRCRLELAGRLSMAAIIERLNGDDGRPTADEAWALALEARDEALTVVWTNEIQQAFSVARPVLDAGDKVGARMAFRDAYDRIIRESRLKNVKAAWSASLGWDARLRTASLNRAVEQGLLSAQTVTGLLPAPSSGVVDAALGLALLPAPAGEDQAKFSERISGLREILSRPRSDSREGLAEAERSELIRRKTEMQDKVSSYETRPVCSE